uniref:SAM_MT_ERG6_SMT domain-containing protein n=1 Tax=Bursaphelenchus xylophilus TaxID=6326 RepID=A0A1I7RUW4_BURXY
MSIDMTSNFFRLLMHFRRHDLVAFNKDHERLFALAKKSNDHAEVTSHYYSVMSAVIDEYFNGNFHFVPPSKRGQSLEEALNSLHRRIAEELELKEGMTCVDIGCGIGTVIQEIAYTGASITGVTIAANEVEIGNKALEKLGCNERCKLIESLDCAYAIYALKYFVDLKPVLEEVKRCLKPGGKLVIYDLVKTDKYDENNEEHRKIVEGLEFACGMPSLHHRSEMVDKCAEVGLQLSNSVNLCEETGKPYHYCFSHSKFFMWLVTSKTISTLIKTTQAMRILPKGFYKFNKTFLRGTVSKIVAGGKMGILDGGEILVFTRE